VLDDFTAVDIDTGESIFVRHSGSGAPLLLLHGFPQTHLMWRRVAPQLARVFTVGCAICDAGHFFPEEASDTTVDALIRFFRDEREGS
jgi:hypothetical protein